MRKVVIGLEVHCELKTVTKNFSVSKNEYTSIPNIHVTPVDLGLPGILPVVNMEAVKKALKTAMALNCTNPDEVLFERKNYYYPDLPKGYQITQVTKPMGKNGYLKIVMPDYEKDILIHQLHLEEDTASLDHYPAYSLIDYNRSGIPLIEIVTEPCISNALEAVKFLETLRDVFIYCEVSEADSKKGQMRCDVNISLTDSDKLGTKVEMKNINSFSSVKAAIEYEIKRQNEVLDKGEKVIQETRRFDEETMKTYSMREKVDAVDYKYFIEPNMPPVKLTKEFLDNIRKEIPRLQYERYHQYTNEYELSEYDSNVLVKDKDIADYFEKLISYGIKPKEACSWVTTVILGSLNKLNTDLEGLFITSKMLSEVIKLTLDNKISVGNAKKVLYRAMDEKVDPIEIIEKEHLRQIDDESVLVKLVNEALDEHEDIVLQFKEGKEYVTNYFVGQVMKKTKGQASPVKTLEIIKEEIKKR